MKTIGLSVVFFSALVFTWFVGAEYVAGDQLHYRYVYSEIGGMAFLPAFAFYNVNLSSKEFFHFIVIYLSSINEINKDFLFAFVDSLFALIVLLIFKKHNLNLIVGFVFILTNYYLLVMYFPAERLKFAFFFFLAAYYFNHIKWRMLFIILSFASHLQALLFVLPALYPFIINFLRVKMSLFKITIGVIFFGFFASISYVLLYEQFISKLVLLSDFDLENLYKLLVLFILSLFVAKKIKIWHVVFTFCILILAAGFLGEERINFIGYMYFVYFYLIGRKDYSSKFIFYILFLYYSLKGVNFVVDILEYGTGYV